MSISVYSNSEKFLNTETIYFSSLNYPFHEGFSTQHFSSFAAVSCYSKSLQTADDHKYILSDWQNQGTNQTINKNLLEQNRRLRILENKSMNTNNEVSQNNISNNGIKPVIWRPFSPAPPSQEDDVAESIVPKRNSRTSSKAVFYSIKPSNVKIGHSKTSVFKAVKKNSLTSVQNSFRSISTKQFSNRNRVYTRSKPYRCEYQNCFKSFARNEELTRHKRIHSGFKPHQCGTCKKRFGRKDHLSKHLKTHLQTSEKKIYQCSFPGCGHRYTRSDALTRHKSTAHAIKRPQK